MEKVLSLIIPTYNMEKYLNKCLDSLIVENMDLLEVLIINDGSKDNSSNIAHEYETKFPNTFRVIDKENGNYGSCINRGLKEAKGKYIKILDSDDSFESLFFNKYISLIKDIDVDLILTDYAIVDENNTIHKICNYNLDSYTIIDFYQLFANNNIDFSIQMHGVTYKRENLLSLNYKQTEGISYTDQEWVYIPITKVKTGIYFNNVLYKYLVGRTGQTVEKSIMKRQSQQLGFIISSLIEKYSKNTETDYNCHLLNQLKTQMYIYQKALIEDSFDIEILKKIDKKIKDNCLELYQMTNSLSSFRIKFVKYWRDNNYKSIPFWMKRLIILREKFN